MNRDLTDYRKSYEKYTLEEKNLPKSPIELFSSWFKEVEQAGGVGEVNAMTISTLGLDGFPKSRIVLLKQFSNDGFVFYTNYESEKGKALVVSNQVCVSFFWPNLERQVIVKGHVYKVEEEQSIQYFHSRPRGSQLGTWCSNQSEVIESSEVLKNKLTELEDKYKGVKIPKPPFWGGYCVKPVEIEFWQGRPNRLHDRIRYAKDVESNWLINRLSP